MKGILVGKLWEKPSQQLPQDLWKSWIGWVFKIEKIGTSRQPGFAHYVPMTVRESWWVDKGVLFIRRSWISTLEVVANEIRKMYIMLLFGFEQAGYTHAKIHNLLNHNLHGYAEIRTLGAVNCLTWFKSPRSVSLHLRWLTTELACFSLWLFSWHHHSELIYLQRQFRTKVLDLSNQ